MEVFMRDIGFSFTSRQIIAEIADILHSPSYAVSSPLPLNFQVHPFKDKRGTRRHSGSGALTLSTLAVAQQSSQEYGE
jgi:RNA-dependent RNA polymerase